MAGLISFMVKVWQNMFETYKLYHTIRTYLKSNLSAYGGVAKRFKILIRHRTLADSAFSPIRALS